MTDKAAKLADDKSEASGSSISHVRRWLVNYPRAVPLAIFFAILAITALSVFAIERNAREREQAQVREAAQSIAFALERRGNNFSSYLRAGAALFTARDDIDLETFRQFVSELRLDENYRGSEGIGWVSVVESADIPAFTQQQRRDLPDFPAIRPRLAEGAVAAAPVTYFYPDTTRNRRALGYDMYSEPVRRAAMDEAQRTVQPTASARIVLAQEGSSDAPGFVIFMPVYRPTPEGSPQDRKLAGFVYSPFNADRVLDAAMESGEFKSLGVALYDDLVPSRDLLVSFPLSGSGGERLEQALIIANRGFLLVVEAPSGIFLDSLSMISLVFGLTLASLLMLLARLLTQQAFEDQARLAFFEEQHSIRNSLTRELNHRVKNTLANVLSILALTRRRASGLDDFADSLEGRIRALSATHDLLTGRDWGATPLQSDIEAELRHFRSANEHEIRIEGPMVELAPNDALSFGLAIHELATNAAKYGALSVLEGRVSILWSLVEENMVEVEWRESNGPEVQSDRGRGFGTQLIEKIVAHELKQPVLLEFKTEGVRCVMRVPVRPDRDFRIREQA